MIVEVWKWVAQRSWYRGTRSISHCSLKILLARVMWLVCFRFDRFFGRFFLRLEPLGVEDAGLIDALVRMRTKEIALRLQQIRWKTRRAITVVIRQRGRKRGTGTPNLIAVETTRRHFGCVLLMALVKYRSRRRFCSAELRRYASTIRFKNFARMMQPPRQIVAMSLRFRFQSYVVLPDRRSSIPCA